MIMAFEFRALSLPDYAHALFEWRGDKREAYAIFLMYRVIHGD